MDANQKDYKPLTFEEFEASFQPLGERTEDLAMTGNYDADAPLTLDEINHLLEHSNVP